MAQAQTQDTFDAVADDLAKALDEAEDSEARYHIRQAAQRIVLANTDHEG